MKIQQQQQSPFVYYNTQNPLQKRSRVTCVTRTRVVQNGHRTAAPLVLSARARVRYGNARGDFPARPGLRSLSERERKMNNKNSKKISLVTTRWRFSLQGNRRRRYGYSEEASRSHCYR